MEIKNIKKLKSGKYKLELDNKEKFVTYDEVILNHNLLFHKEIDTNLLNTLNIETSYYNIYTKVIKYISTKMRSKKEIINYLKKLEVDEADTNKIIDNLLKIGLINDKYFVKAFIYDKIHLNHYGRLKIKKELVQHDICENIIEEELSNYDNTIFEENLKKLILKKIKNTKYSGYVLKQKILYELENMGYESDLILNVFNNISIPSNIDSDTDKYYKNLSKKYEGNNLITKLKNKLYSKGYSTEEINNAIEKRIG